MLIKEEFLKKLRSAFDLNIYEVKIWTALLSRGVAAAGELSDISNVPRSRSYDILESLEKKGFVIMKLGKPIKYIAVKPEEIVKRMKERIATQSSDKLSFIENVKKDTIFGELNLLYKQGITKVDPTSLSGALKGRDNIYSHLKNMLERAEKSVVIVTSKDGVARKFKRYKGNFQKLADKNVKIKIAAPMQGVQSKHLNEVKKVAQVRNIDSINARFVMIDNSEILFMVNNDTDIHEGYDTGIWVNTPFFTKAFSTMFDTTWQGLKTSK